MKCKLAVIIVVLSIFTVFAALSAYADEPEELQDSYTLISDAMDVSYTGEAVELEKYAVVKMDSELKKYVEDFGNQDWYCWEVYMDHTSEWRAQNTLVEGVDYTVSYENNTEVGTATQIITGIGKYTGTIKRTFSISKKRVKATVTVNSDRTVTIKPAEKFDITKVYIQYPGNDDFKLVEGRDYKILSSGSIKLTTDFLDAKTGYKPYDLSNDIYCESKNYWMLTKVRSYNIKYLAYTTPEKRVYSGKQKSTSIGLNSCKEGVNYKIVYDKKTRTKIGRYYFTVKAIGKNVGSFRSHFDIVPKRPSKITSAKRTSSKAVVRWKTVKNCTGYQVQLYKNVWDEESEGEYKLIYKSVKISDKKRYQKTFKSVKKSKYTAARVRAYKVVNGKYYYSSWKYRGF